MSEKSNFMSFNRVFWSYIAVWIISLILLAATKFSVAWFPGFFALLFALGLRMHLVKKYNINECSPSSPANEIGEGIIGFFCWPCSVAQMARYMYGYTKVLDGDADINREDNYQMV